MPLALGSMASNIFVCSKFIKFWCVPQKHHLSHQSRILVQDHSKLKTTFLDRHWSGFNDPRWVSNQFRWLWLLHNNLIRIWNSVQHIYNLGFGLEFWVPFLPFPRLCLFWTVSLFQTRLHLILLWLLMLLGKVELIILPLSSSIKLCLIYRPK